MAKDGEGCFVGDADMFDGILDEVAVERIFGDDNSKESCRVLLGEEELVGWFVESDFFYSNEVTDVNTGGDYFCELRGEWVVRREGGVLL